MDMRERKYKIPEVAAFIGASPKTIWNKIGDGSVAVYRFGRSVRIGESEVQRILEEGFCPRRSA